MPLDGMGNYIESKADNTSDVIGFGDVGGIGQLIYHTFRFKDYEYEITAGETVCLKPVVHKGMKPDIDKVNGFSGKELFLELYNLGKKINDFSEKRPYDELLIEFCKKVAHPYSIDSLYSMLLNEQVTATEDGFMIEREAMFSVSYFMHDLKNFYTAAQFYFALKAECAGYGEYALDLASEGKFFDGLPFFEKYKLERCFEKHEPVKDETSTDDMIKEMKADRKKAAKQVPEETISFVREPFDYFDELRDQLMDIIPDFHMRLKVNPKNNNVVFAADVHSVFDIAWYSLARMIVDFGPPEDAGQKKIKREGTLTTCPICGEAFIRRNNRHTYCDNIECKRAYDAQRAQKSRDKLKLEATKAKSKK